EGKVRFGPGCCVERRAGGDRGELFVGGWWGGRCVGGEVLALGSLGGMVFSKDGVGQRFQRVSDQIPYRLRVGRILVFTALRISNDAVVNGVDFELDLSICILHGQREAWGDRPTVRRPRERRTFRNRPVGPTLT